MKILVALIYSLTSLCAIADTTAFLDEIESWSSPHEIQDDRRTITARLDFLESYHESEDIETRLTSGLLRGIYLVYQQSDASTSDPVGVFTKIIEEAPDSWQAISARIALMHYYHESQQYKKAIDVADILLHSPGSTVNVLKAHSENRYYRAVNGEKTMSESSFNDEVLYIKALSQIYSKEFTASEETISVISDTQMQESLRNSLGAVRDAR